MKKATSQRKSFGKRARTGKARLRSKKTEVSKVKAAADYFVRSVLVRGEAAVATGGELPPGATHEIVKENKTGLPTIRRRRFSLV